LVHLDGKECEKVNHDKLKYFHNGWFVVLRTKQQSKCGNWYNPKMVTRGKSCNLKNNGVYK
jgi:hypothetical protein